MARSALKATRIPWTITFQVLMTVVLLMVLTAVLLSLVFSNTWLKRRNPIPGLDLNSGFESNDVWVDYSAASLVLVASWSSSVALPMVGSMMMMASHVVAADMIWSSKHELMQMLPTPSQLAVLTDMVDAKKWTLIAWFAGSWSSARRKSSMRWTIEFCVVTQSMFLTISLAIIAADTWLHATTKSIGLTFLSKVEDADSFSPTYLYSRGLAPECTNSNGSICSLGGAGTIMNPFAIGALLVDDPLTQTRVRPSSDNSTYLLMPRLAPERGVPSNYQNFSAVTYGASADCSATTDCSLRALGTGLGTLGFECQSGFSGSIQYPSWLFVGQWQQDDKSYDRMSAYPHDDATIDIGVIGFLESSVFGSDDLESFDPPPTVTSIHGDNNQTISGIVVAMHCSVQMRNMTYKWTNGTRPPDILDSRMDGSAANIVRGPLLSGYLNSSLASSQQDHLRKAFGLAMAKEMNYGTRFMSSNEFAASALLSFLGAVITQQPPEELWLADSIVVTRVPKAPLFALVILNLWYAILACLLFGLTWHVLGEGNTRQDIIEVQQLLTVNGLATAAVKRHRGDLSANDDDLRVGVENADGKWQFRVWLISGATPESKALLSDEERAEEVPSW